jgi:formylglycine-generating enzyme
MPQMKRLVWLIMLACFDIDGSLAAAAESPAEKQVTNSLGMTLMRIEPGQFIMGSGEAPPKTRDEWLTRDEDEAPARRVKISQPYYLGVFEVTNRHYEAFDPEHRQLRGSKPEAKNDYEPVSNASWQQAVDFCQWLSKREGQPYRLPTEAEWEYACRAGTTTPFHTGETITPEQANLGVDKDGKRLGVRTVGSYPPNAWGLHDMHGNVAEWCLDWHAPYASGEQTDPVGRTSGHARVTRGWSWLGAGFQAADRFCRSANRTGLLPDDANRYTGFRVVIGELPKTEPLPAAELPLHQQNVLQTAPAKQPRYASKPVFIDYVGQKANPTIAPETWGPIFSKHNHFTSVCVCPNGDVLMAWYSCAGEADRQLAQAASRLRAGSDRWEPASFFFGTPDVNTHAPVLLRHGSRIYHFATQSFRGWDDSSNIMRTSDDSGATWSQPTIILSRNHPDHLTQPCSAMVLDDGT